MYPRTFNSFLFTRDIYAYQISHFHPQNILLHSGRIAKNVLQVIFKHSVIRKTKVIVNTTIIIDSVSQGYIDDKDTKLTKNPFVLPN